MAYSLNVTVVPHDIAGLSDHLAHRRRPAGGLHPEFAGWTRQGQRRDRACGNVGAVSVYVTDTTNVVLDIDGYFAPGNSSTLEFYPLTPCRVVDTRKDDLSRGLGRRSLTGGQRATSPYWTSSCIPSGISPQAYSLNFTAVPYPSTAACWAI